MAMSMQRSGGGGSRRRRGRRNQPMSEINVTPLVDVMLVLLIVFMVAAPLLTVGVPIDLPQSQAKSLNTDSKPVTVSVSPDGRIFVQEDEVQFENLIETLNAASPDGPEGRVYVRGDTNANYGAVMRVMGRLSGAGYSRIGLITESEQTAGQ